LFFLSCSKKQNSEIPAVPNDTLQLHYATGFAIYYHNNFKEVVVYSLWREGEIFARYYLTKNKNQKMPENGTKVVIPLQTIALTSVTQIEFLNLLGEQHTITGISSPNLVYNSDIRQRTQQGEITDLGDAFNINVERALMLRPQALMASGFNQNDPNMTRLSRANVPVLYNNEWMENMPLGRAEWIKFVSAFYDKEAEADSVFSLVVQRYNEIKNTVSQLEQRPNIMSGSNFRGTWYMPGGQNFMGQLFADAGAAYFYADDDNSGSLPLNIETVIMNFSQTDVWLNSNFNSIDELLKADAKHALFRPVQLGAVYNFNRRALSSSANDFWESAVARPDVVLADVIAILHPHILPEHELVYAEKLK
jgi:iron complex transport system substrate-binding protein